MVLIGLEYRDNYGMSFPQDGGPSPTDVDLMSIEDKEWTSKTLLQHIKDKMPMDLFEKICIEGSLKMLPTVIIDGDSTKYNITDHGNKSLKDIGVVYPNAGEPTRIQMIFRRPWQLDVVEQVREPEAPELVCPPEQAPEQAGGGGVNLIARAGARVANAEADATI